MNTILKRGAVLMLALLAAPVVIVVSRNPQLVLPTWVLLGYAVARKIFGSERQAMGAAFAVICGQVAWQILSALEGPRPNFAWFDGLVLAAGLIWLAVTKAKIAAWSVAALELGFLVIHALSLPRVVAALPADMGGVLLSLVAVVIIAPLAAILLLLASAWPKRAAALLEP